MKFTLIFVILIIFAQIISAQCLEGQIDINTADKEKLMEITYIGDVRADRIIEMRADKPFESLDELVKINGIGNITLEKIKAQGLACVNLLDSSNSNDNLEEEIFSPPNQKEKHEISFNSTLKKKIQKPIEPIILNPKNISEETNKIYEEKEKKNYRIHFLIAFSLLLGFLFFLKRKKYKTEFQ